MTVGPMEGTVLAISRELDDLGGYAMTRLTAPILQGAVVWPVESTLDFPDFGSFVARGTLYTFTAKSPVTLEGVQFTDGVTVFNGAKTDLREAITITDFSRARTAIDLLRRALLVNFAEGTDLGVVGNNLGVQRFPGVSDDPTYREVIKALAYNPRGTIFGIEALLNALLGAGNFAIFEDLISRPNEVFVELLGTALLNAEFAGKAFFHPRVLRPEDSATQVTIAGAPPIITAYSVAFKDENHLSDFRNQLPSAETLVEYPGDAGTTLWTYNGPSEGADVTQIAGEAIEIDDSSAADVAQYIHNARIQPLSTAELSMVQSPNTFGLPSGSDGRQWGGIIEDGGRIMGWGAVDNFPDYDVGLVNPVTGAFISGAAVTGLSTSTLRPISIRKVGQDRVELYVDGNLVQVEAYSAFPTSTDTRLIIGANSVAEIGVIGRIKQTGFFSTTPIDFWASRGVDGEAFPAASTDKTFEDTVASPFLSGDVGKRVRVSGSVADTGSTTGEGEALLGRNNGIYEINTFTSASRVTLKGPDKTEGMVETATPTVFDANDINAFQYPDDLGKEIVISGAVNPINNGTFVITDLLDEADGTTSLSGRSSPTPERTGIAVASAAAFVSESELSWRLDPVFINETGLSFELSNTGTEAAGVLTLRQALPTLSGAVTRILEIAYTDVLSMQLLLDFTVEANLVSAGPPVTLDKYGFYLSDPLGVVRRYLDIITVAGVIPDVLEK